MRLATSARSKLASPAGSVTVLYARRCAPGGARRRRTTGRSLLPPAGSARMPIAIRRRRISTRWASRISCSASTTPRCARSRTRWPNRRTPRSIRAISPARTSRARASSIGRTICRARSGAAERAVKADERLIEARFNRALALESLFLEEQARQAWQDYVARDPGSEWADEARRHLEKLQRGAEQRGPAAGSRAQQFAAADHRHVSRGRTRLAAAPRVAGVGRRDPGRRCRPRRPRAFQPQRLRTTNQHDVGRWIRGRACRRDVGRPGGTIHARDDDSRVCAWHSRTWMPEDIAGRRSGVCTVCACAQAPLPSRSSASISSAAIDV